MLNDSQRKLVESSIWVVNTALKKQGYEKDQDLKQDALLYMCQCAEKFDDTKGVKWTTYAYKNVYLFIKRTKAKERKRESAVLEDDLFDLCETTEEIFDDTRTYDNAKIKFDKIVALCTPQERQILQQKVCGYTHPQIAKQMNCTTYYVNNKMRGLRKKVKDFTLN